jgi:hypothetical protein
MGLALEVEEFNVHWHLSRNPLPPLDWKEVAQDPQPMPRWSRRPGREPSAFERVEREISAPVRPQQAQSQGPDRRQGGPRGGLAQGGREWIHWGLTQGTGRPGFNEEAESRHRVLVQRLGRPLIGPNDVPGPPGT